MTLQQMRYLLAIAERGSISNAAQALYVSQSTISEALREAEREMGVTIFNRSNRGIEVTLEGRELLALARQVVQQDDLLNSRFGRNGSRGALLRFAVSGQHYSLGVDAFSELVKELGEKPYAFTYRETTTEEVIEDVKSLRSHIGLLYLSFGNERIIKRALDFAGLSFTQILEARPQVLMSKNNPLAARKTVKPSELANLPFVSFEQGADDSYFFAEEPLAEMACQSTISVRDRSTMVSLLASGSGYTIGSGAHSAGMDHGIVGIPLKTTERMQIGYILSDKRDPSSLTLRYIEKLKEQVAAIESLNNA